MKHRFAAILIIILAIFVLASCDFLPLPSDTTIPTEIITETPYIPTDTPTITETSTIEISPTLELTPTPTPTQEPTPAQEPTPTLEPTPTPAPTPPDMAELPVEDLGAAGYTEAYQQIEYISNNLGSDLPFVEEQCAYITGQSMAMDGQTDIIFDSVEWLSDPEATQQYLIDFPGAMPEDYEFIQEIGYIRNIDTTTVTYRTSPETRYFLNIPLYTSSIGEVDYNDFRNWLFTTTNGFVIVCTVDDVIARIEWIFMP